jgi:hypothetical protein
MRTIILLLLVSFSVLAKAGSTPDSLAVSKLYSTSWTLSGKYRMSGIFNRKHKIESPDESMITIYPNEIHTTLTSGKYQICASRHRNGNEFWLDCALPDQFIYRVISIKADELTIDVLTRPKGERKYVRTSRNYYTRKRN